MVTAKASVKNKADIEQLLNSCNLPYSDLTDDHLAHFIVAIWESELVGVIGLEIYNNKALLRSLAVNPFYRSQGIGVKLVNKLERYAVDQGVKKLYLLTTTAARFFSKLGFTEIKRETVPASIKQTKEFADICPVSAVCMKKVV